MVDRRNSDVRISVLENRFDNITRRFDNMDVKLDELLTIAAERRGAEKATKLIAHGITVIIGAMGGVVGGIIHSLPK